MTPDRMVSSVRRQTNMPSAQGRATDTEIMEYLNDAQQLLASEIIKAGVNHFETDETITFVADQTEYSLPTYLRDDRITMVELLNTDGTRKRGVEYIRYQDQGSSPASATNGIEAQYYYIKNRKIGFLPRPSAAVTDAVKVHYVQQPPDMYWGTMPAAGSITTSTAVIGGTTLAGSVNTEEDYYKNAQLRFLTNTPKGVEYKITDFNPTTATITVTPVWVVADVDTENFVILSPIPDQYHLGMVAYAVMEIASKSEDMGQKYEAARAKWQTTLKSIEENISPRHTDANEYVRLPDDFEE